MARSLRVTYLGAFYHVTSRGNEQKDVFKSKRDREKFLEYFESARKTIPEWLHRDFILQYFGNKGLGKNLIHRDDAKFLFAYFI